MKYWFVIFSLSLLNYTYADSDSFGDDFADDGEKRNSESRVGTDYSSGNQDRHTSLLYGDTGSEKRSIMTGDTFTPLDMLPIAEKLIKKVEEPGSGKGFVSSTKGPQELADKLFEAFFFSTKRIVTLKDYDISGLDALQALAIEGEPADKTLTEDVTEPAQRMYLRGQIVNINKPRKSHFKLVTKTVPKKVSQKKITKEKRRGILLAKKLPKQRKLIVNQQSKQSTNRSQKIRNKDNKKIMRKGKKINKNIKMKTTKVGKRLKPGKASPKCRWNYVCVDPADLDTCTVHTSCGDTSSTMSDYKRERETKEIKEFRRMLGITRVDEEVEKILESRNIKIRPANLEAINKVESLSEFFNNIIDRENTGSTAPIQPDVVV
ncbi:uncharacterized protein LOC116779751 [Danaus plexippus]|uniref:uncharacterized protein LOC133319260 n=1 Tax=Danaus plexippus TaxID=13037 RepID=UPI002AB0CD7E|nr:uncharacterized protein LOC133319260 [Danaus plexippus]XP_061379024.1 uncharacterized protein LOC116779751 [Danaus plexippus]